MHAAPRARILGCPVDVVSMQDAVARVTALAEDGAGGRPGLVVTLNPEMVMRAQRDREFRRILEAAALLVPDGVGIVRALHRRGYAGAARVGGADLQLEYFPVAAARGHRIALAGGAPGVAAAAAMWLRRRVPELQIVAAEGGRPDERLAARLRAARPHLVLAAFGAGLQERFLVRYLDAIGAKGGIGIGGTLDYFSGRVRRAPVWLQDAGLEWAWRLVRQPWRLRRQLVLPRYWMLERAEAARGAAVTRGR